LAYLLGAKRRYGHTYIRGGDGANLRFLLTERIDQQTGRHTVDENRALVAHVTGRVPDGPADIRLGPLDPTHHSDAARMLGHLREPLLGIHAGCSTYKGRRKCHRRDTCRLRPVRGGADRRPHWGRA
ncbi:MAG: hypothetical protein JXQ75_00470, partial [Phycisphaerae bacterium]|nr:hypothetical protein [Phycisphaerae bacterium]